MKILIVTNHSYMLYRFRRELIRQLQQEHEVVLSMPFVGHEEDFQKMGLRCIHTELDRRGKRLKSELRLIGKYRKLLRKERPDLVLTYSIKPNIYAGLLCANRKIPYCANVQGLGTAFQKKNLAKLIVPLYKLALRRAKVVFFENQKNADLFVERNILPPEKITVLPGAGINLEAFPFVPYPENDRVRFLYLGRIMKEKGMDELFAAVRRLHRELGQKIRLDLVGFFDDRYETQVQELVDEGIAVFHGFQTEPKPYYAQADCVVLPSYHEGLSNVLLESAATGRPVITSRIPGCQETVIPDVSGLLCQAQDAESLYLQMKKMAMLPPEERAKMGAAGRQKVQQEFDKQMVVERTVQSIFSHISNTLPE